MSSEIRVLKDKRTDVTVLPKTVADAVSYGNKSVADELASLRDGLAGKQPTIDASHKLDYSLLSNTPTIPTVEALTTSEIDTIWSSN